MVDRATTASGPLVSGVPEVTSRGDLPIGGTAGDYVITELIARGGCGSVYRASDLRDGRTAAVKVLHAPLAGMPKMVQRFEREVRVVGMLRHPSIVEIYDVGSLPDRRPYFAMEYLSGRTLSTILDEQGRMSPGEALEVIEPVCAALAAAHAAGVIHRDVKASNIMVDGATVKLLDFGIAKLVGPQEGPGGLTSEGRQVGTLTIMAPEQLLGGPVDARIDIYALGVLLFRLLTGRLPFDSKNALTLVQQHLEEPAPRPSQRIPLAPSLDALVLRCLEKLPERRFPTVEEFLDALRQAVRGARRRGSPDSPSLGIAVYVDVHMGIEGDDLDSDPAYADTGFVLDLAEEWLHDQSFALAAITGSSALGVRALPSDPAEQVAARAAVVEAAAELHRQISARPDAHALVHANVCIHAGTLTWTTGDGGQITGGPLVRTEAWAPRGAIAALCATPAVVEGIGDRGDVRVLPVPEEAPSPLVTRLA